MIVLESRGDKDIVVYRFIFYCFRMDQITSLLLKVKPLLDNGMLSYDEEKSRITYKWLKNGDKTYKLTDPEEQVRLYWFDELVTTYQYSPKDIGLEVEMPKRVPNQIADLVIYEQNSDGRYFVIEFKKSDISDNEFEQAVKQGIGNGRVLASKYFGTIAWDTVRFFEKWKDTKLDDAFYAFPVRYGVPEERTFTKNWLVDIKPVQMEELKTILSKAHLTIWKWGKRNPAEAFGEVAKIIFIKVADEKAPRKAGDHYEFQRKRNESVDKLWARIHALYDKEKYIDPQVFQEPIKLDDKELAMVVEHLQAVNLNKTDLDVKGWAFQQFLGNFFKGDFWQYFTPTNATGFCLQMIADEVDNNSKVLDPACGSGGFLLQALDLMRKKADGYFPDYLTDPQEATKHFQYWHDFAEKKLFGIEISESIARVSKMNMILHDDGHTNVISHDALESTEKMRKINLWFEEETFDLIITNPPFGAIIKNTESDYLDDYELWQKRKSQKTEILFMERCWQFLKPGGSLAVVLPDGILTNSSLQYVREYILEHYKLRAVVSLPQDAFRYYGAGVKSSILLLQKWGETKEIDYKIFMATANKIGIDGTGRKCEDDLPGIVEQFRIFKQNPDSFM